MYGDNAVPFDLFLAEQFFILFNLIFKRLSVKKASQIAESYLSDSDKSLMGQKSLMGG